MRNVLAILCSGTLLLSSAGVSPTPQSLRLHPQYLFAKEAFSVRAAAGFQNDLTASVTPALRRMTPASSGSTSPASRSFTTRLVMTGAVVAGIALAAVAINEWFIERRVIRDPLSKALPDVRRLPEPIRLFAALYLLYIAPFVEVEGFTDQNGIFVANHGYFTALDGAILGVLLTLRHGRIPKILITGESRAWPVRLQRWILNHYGLAVIVPPDVSGNGKKAKGEGLTKVLTEVLTQGYDVILFPSGEAAPHPEQQLLKFSTSAIYAARASKRSIIPVGMGGFPLDWTPWDAISAGYRAQKTKHPLPYHFSVYMGRPLEDDGIQKPEEVRDRMARDVRHEMEKIPSLWENVTQEEQHLRLSHNHWLTYVDHKPAGPVAMNVIYYHGLQGSLREAPPNIQEIVNRQGVRWIAFDRPGMGTSQRSRHRTLDDLLPDIRELAEKVIPGEPFALLGYSGGTVYVQAHAPHLKPTAVALVSPFRQPSLFLSWMHFPWHNKTIVMAARAFPVQTASFFRARAQTMRENWSAYTAQVRTNLSKSDDDLLAQEHMQRLWRANRLRSFFQGARHVLSDLLAITGPLTLHPADWKNIPVLLVHGTDDRTASVSITHFLERFFPKVETWILPGAGHYLVLSHLEEILIRLKRLHEKTLQQRQLRAA